MFNCFVYPAMQMSGQIYYHLSRARQARRIRDVVLVRLEQIAPFPHDLVSKVDASTSHPLARLEDLHLFFDSFLGVDVRVRTVVRACVVCRVPMSLAGLKTPNQDSPSNIA